jgi:Cytochrome c7 and related cytochrome c
MRPISYEAHCQSCHAFQFDANNPELRLPHGNAAAVRDFLRSLPTQYAEFGRRVKGITEQRPLEEFVAQQMAAIRQQTRTGEDMQREVFFNTARTGPDGRPRYAGCAYCHEVKDMGDGVPAVTAPVIPNRWLWQGRFDHAQHQTVACATCHDAVHSTRTADVLLPPKQLCASCHSSQGTAASSCATCHRYHSTSERIIARRE